MNLAAQGAPALILNPQTLQVGHAACWVDITGTECELLQAFATAPGQRVDTGHMLGLGGNPEIRLDKRALEVRIVRLRKKLEKAGARTPTIKAIRGSGYQLCVPLRTFEARR